MDYAEIWNRLHDSYGGADISVLQRPYQLAVPLWVFVNDRITLHTSLVIEDFISENHLIWSLCAGLADSHDDPEWTEIFNLYYRAEWQRIQTAVAQFPGPERFLLLVGPPPLAFGIFRYVGHDRFNLFEDADIIEVRAAPAGARHNADLLRLLEYINSDTYVSGSHMGVNLVEYGYENSPHNTPRGSPPRAVAMEVDEEDHSVSPTWDEEEDQGVSPTWEDEPMTMPVAVGGLQGTDGNPPDYEEVADHYGPNQNIGFSVESPSPTESPASSPASSSASSPQPESPSEFMNLSTPIGSPPPDYEGVSPPPPQYYRPRSFRSEHGSIDIPAPRQPHRYYGGRNTYRAPSNSSSDSHTSDLQESADVEMDVAGEVQSNYGGERQSSMSSGSTMSSEDSPTWVRSPSPSPQGSPLPYDSQSGSPAQSSQGSPSLDGSQEGSPVHSAASSSSRESGMFQMDDDAPQEEQRASGPLSWLPKLPFQRR